MVIYLFKGSISHWQESRSRNISRRNDSIFPRSLEKIEFSLLFLFSIFKIFRKKFYFSSRFMRLLNPFSFSSRFSRFLRKNSLSLLDWWDSETQISFSSQFSRFWEDFPFLFSIYEIFKKQFSFSSRISRFFRNRYLSLLDLWEFFPFFYYYLNEKCILLERENLPKKISKQAVSKKYHQQHQHQLHHYQY